MEVEKDNVKRGERIGISVQATVGCVNVLPRCGLAISFV
jgi:hypothetical protein